MGRVRVRMFGSLHTFRKERGELVDTQVELPDEGMSARELAQSLGLPLDKIEGVFRDHKVHGLELHVVDGDSVAFVSRGVPGPHRFALGLYHAGKG